MESANHERDLVLRGIVVPSEWDIDGLVRTVAILTRDEGEYQVEPGGAGGQLVAHLQREILAQAEMLNGREGVHRVRVHSFAILEWNESGEEFVSTLRLGNKTD
jgi:hypothetical protein